jgi:hypothetical protein
MGQKEDVRSAKRWNDDISERLLTGKDAQGAKKGRRG